MAKSPDQPIAISALGWFHSAPSAPAQPQAEPDAHYNCACQLPSVGDRNKSSLLVADFYNANRDSPCTSTATARFTANACIANTACARPTTVSINDLGNW